MGIFSGFVSPPPSKFDTEVLVGLGILEVKVTLGLSTLRIGKLHGDHFGLHLVPSVQVIDTEVLVGLLDASRALH